MEKVYVVNVFDSYSQEKSPWKVFKNINEALEYKEKIESDRNLNDNEEDWYVSAEILEFHAE